MLNSESYGEQSYSENYGKQLKHLYKILLESCNGYIEACKHISSPDLQALFEKTIEDRQMIVKQIRDKMAEYGGSSDDMEGGSEGLIHRSWMQFKTAFTSSSDQSILESCRNGEQVVLDLYDDVLQGEVLYDMTLKTFLMEQRLKVNENFIELDKRYFALFKKDPSL